MSASMIIHIVVYTIDILVAMAGFEPYTCSCSSWGAVGIGFGFSGEGNRVDALPDFTYHYDI